MKRSDFRLICKKFPDNTVQYCVERKCEGVWCLSHYLFSGDRMQEDLNAALHLYERFLKRIHSNTFTTEVLKEG